ncbi:hypothetical protein GPECTOR_5g71 [Gonium pectorale]|uniref:Protein kinase domain-containing protein n=1 Tax=Gonium pectorale TaxID=33097 RepID=A0A150GX06_GONPE|nr:hypothetical protein GPECTOR_5g71 [Gonium pectorale]|eukprot:KXZ54417.1 hypothetical protein GPECTOR_5g71 [Gonium pectorale]
MPLFAKGFRVGTGPGPDQDRWLIVKKLGEGQFAEVYEVKDTLDGEKRVLKKIQERMPSLVCTVLTYGSFEDRFFMIMELLGNNVAEARKAAGGRFDLSTARRLAGSMLRGLEEVHAAGFVHRDVKPANFAVGPAFADPLTDFGLARRYLDDAGEVLPERTDTSFRGSTTYASVYAHAEQDLGRRDDLWSWLYCTIELLEGTLPWRGTDQNKDPDSREAVLRMKHACIQDPSRYLRSSGGPHPQPLNPALLGPVAQLSHYIYSLGFGDAPDYGHLYGLLDELPDDALPGMLLPPGAAGPGPGGLGLAAGGQGPQGPWGGEAQQQQQMLYQQQQQQQQYYQHQHPQQQQHQHPQAGGMQGGYWPAREGPGGWAGDGGFHRYGGQHPGAGPPPLPDSARSPPQDTPASPPPEFGGGGGSGGGGGGYGGEPPPPPLPSGGEPPPPPYSGGGGGGVEAAPLADVSPELTEALLVEALAERLGGDGCVGSEAAQVAQVAEYVELVKQGHVSDEAHDVANRLMGLDPLEALATLGYVVDALAAHTPPQAANTAAVALSALGAFSRDAARRAMAK